MTGQVTNGTEAIVATLLHIGDRVLAVDNNMDVKGHWERNTNNDNTASTPERLTNNNTDLVLYHSASLAQKAFETGVDVLSEYTTISDDGPVTFNIRVIHAHPLQGHLFIVHERIAKPGILDFKDDRWKIALDVSDVGMWELNFETGTIYVSKRWTEIFGYSNADISTRARWMELVHPEDRENVAQSLSSYMEGKTPVYSVEMRYLTPNGDYRWIASKGIVVSRTADGRPHRAIGTHTDIHERKAAELEHYSTAQLLSRLIDNLQQGIIVTDQFGKIIFANQEFCALYNLESKPELLKGMDVAESIEIRKEMYKDPAGFRKKTRDALANRVPVLNEELECIDGRTFSRDYIPVTLGKGYNGEIWKITDITEKKVAEHRYEQQRVFYERILNSISADIMVQNASGHFLFINPSAIKEEEVRTKLIGATNKEYCKELKLAEVIAENRDSFFNIAVKEHRIVEWEERLQSKNGRVTYNMRYYFPVFNDKGALDIMILYGLNITDRILAEEALKISRDVFASAFDYSGVGMALISTEGQWLNVNSEVCNITGYTKEELQTRTYQDVAYPKDIETYQQLVEKLLSREMTACSLEKRLVSKANKIVWVALTVSVVWDSESVPKFFIAQIADITAKKELADQINRKNKELEATRENLVNKVNQLEELNRIVAHNLRGPAKNIEMLSQRLMIDDNSPEAAEEPFTKEEASELIYQSSAALIASLDTVMELMQIKLNKTIPYNNCNINELITDITNQLHGEMYEKHALIELNLEVNEVSYPKVYLESILYNLISNALKYCKATVPPVISISTKLADGHVNIIVKDNGLGIDLDKYGEKVFSLHQVFHKGFESKGVGLYMTKTQLESLGGSISVSSTVDVGSEFIVIL